MWHNNREVMDVYFCRYEMEKLYPSKIMKVMLFILITDGTSKQHQRMAQKVFIEFEWIRQILKHLAFY